MIRVRSPSTPISWSRFPTPSDRCIRPHPMETAPVQSGEKSGPLENQTDLDLSTGRAYH